MSSAWSDYLYGFAEHAATKSKDSTRVGAVLVHDHVVVLTAYNGPPMGVRDAPERRDARPEKYLWASHAEANLVAFAARKGVRTEGCTVYVTHFPCASCSRTLIQAGVSRVVVGPGKTSMDEKEFEAARTMFREAGVTVVDKK